MGSRMGLHRVHFWWKVKAFYYGHDEPCATLYLIKFVELWLSQKRLAACCECTCGKRPKHFIETWTLRRDNAVELVHHLNRTKRGSRANCQRWGVCSNAVGARITFKFSAKTTLTLRILNQGYFHPDRSSGDVVPRWKSPDVMVDCEFGENRPILCLVWVRVKITPLCGQCEFGVKITWRYGKSEFLVSLLIPWHCTNWQNSTNL